MQKQTLIHGVQMLILGIMIEIATWIVYLLALLQFGWRLVTRDQNSAVADFGSTLSDWIQKASAFLTGASENKPFPWAAWGKQDADEEDSQSVKDSDI